MGKGNLVGFFIKVIVIYFFLSYNVQVLAFTKSLLVNQQISMTKYI